MAALSASFARLSIARPNTTSAPQPQQRSYVNLGFSKSIQGNQLSATPNRPIVMLARSFEVFAAQNTLRRQRLAEKQRLRNKTRRSAIGTRSRKCLGEIERLVKEGAKSEEDFTTASQWMSEAYTEIDRAVDRNILHSNTGDRRKSKLARARRDALIQLGIYTPA